LPRQALAASDSQAYRAVEKHHPKMGQSAEANQPAYQRCASFNKLNPFHETLEQALKADSFRPKHNRRSAK
ncbi:fused ISPsy20 transposase IstB/transcriptional regulator LysR family protein, partial [Pseudomonas amygdali pv. morsprunorum str. M302280]